MKKNRLLAILAAAVFTFSFAGCENDETVAEKILGEKTEVNDSNHEHTFATTWTSDATNHWYAATCEHTEQVKDKSAHTFGDWTTTTEATEATEGSKKRVCSVCNYEATETIAILNHTHSVGTKHDAVSGTCQTKGTIEYYECSNSGCTVKLDKDGNVLESVEGEFGTHSVGTKHEAVSGTCQTKGTLEYYDCSNSDCTVKLDKDGNVLESVEGEFGAHAVGTKHDAVAATCTEAGTLEYYDCSNSDCTAKLDKDGNVLESVAVAALGHSWGDYSPDNNATAESEGTKTASCTRDGCTATDTIPESLVFVEGGTIVGSVDYDKSVENGYIFKEGRTVNLSSFYISKYEVTQKLYNEVLKDDTDVNASPSSVLYEPDDGETQELRPVDRVSWYDAVYFCNKLSEKEGLDCVYTITNIARNGTLKTITNAKVTADLKKNGYRLPTEAEWEYAARGGKKSTTEQFKYAYAGADATVALKNYASVDNNINDIGWYNSNSNSKTHQVGKKSANALGLRDMCGNVMEWCYDFYGKVNTGIETDPVGASSGSMCILRGGSYTDAAYNLPVSRRIYQYQGIGTEYYGIRLVRNAQ